MAEGRAIETAPLHLRLSVYVHLEGGELKFSRRFSFPSPLVQRRAIELARLFARRGREMLAEWQALAKALDGTVRTEGDIWTEGSTTLHVDRLGSAITIDGWREKIHGSRTQLFTRLRCPRISVESVEVIALASSCAYDPPLPAGFIETAGPASLAHAYTIYVSRTDGSFLTASLAEQILVCRPDRILVRAEGVTLLFSGFEREADRIGPACNLAAALAAQGAQGSAAGPYR